MDGRTIDRRTMDRRTTDNGQKDIGQKDNGQELGGHHRTDGRWMTNKYDQSACEGLKAKIF